MTYRNLLRPGIAVLAASALALAGCSSDPDNDATETTTATTTVAADGDSKDKDAAEDDAPVVLNEAFVKAMPADKGMTAIFGTLENKTDKDMHLVEFTTSLGEAKYEIHEVVDGVMQEREDGIVIPAKETFELKPGGDHLMIMNYYEAIEAGDELDATLIFEDGTEVELKNIPARTIASGEENYGGDGEIQDGAHQMMKEHGDKEENKEG